jgi:hypothetical protein
MQPLKGIMVFNLHFSVAKVKEMRYHLSGNELYDNSRRLKNAFNGAHLIITVIIE